MTYPFDVALSHQIYGELFAPFAAELAAVEASDLRARRRDAPAADQPAGHRPGVGRHLCQARGGRRRCRVRLPRHELVRPRPRHLDGGLARAPSRSCAALRRRRASKEYLGLGENTPPAASAAAHGPGHRRPRLHPADVVLGASDLGAGAAGREQYPRSLRPERASRSSPRTISPTPGSKRAATSAITGSSISRPTAWSPSRAAKCAAQPALLTSFGGDGSDGLLTFREIFDLHLDADLVILSACDTAGKASAAATQQAGLSTGGDVALDGLVRAFVGAGGRLVIASHWPVPDDFNATAAADHRIVLGAAGHADGDRAHGYRSAS